MRRQVLLVLGMGLSFVALAVGVAAAAGGEEPVTIRVGEETEVTPTVGFSPRVLPRTSYAPIRLSLSQEVREMYGYPPAERELLIELDRNVSIQTKGLPVCHLGLQTGVPVNEACKGAVVGFGEETVQVAYPESKAINLPAKVQILNGGERDGAITMFVYATFSNPISGSLIIRVVFTRIHNGRFGWLADATLPQIAEGYGSLYDLNLTIGRQYGYEGRKASVLSARCIDGRLLSHLRASFEDGTSGEATISRACTPMG